MSVAAQNEENHVKNYAEFKAAIGNGNFSLRFIRVNNNSLLTLLAKGLF
jgi:hypothetical protein